MILAIDPGTLQSGWCCFEGGRVLRSGVADNYAVLKMLQSIRLDAPRLAIEMVASYGMPVGKEVFETCVWIGRFQQASALPTAAELIYRKDVKMHLCGTSRAKESHVRQALIDLLGVPGTKKLPGPTYGVHSHAWSALAVAVVALAKNPAAAHA